jgi:hypothetical protein
MSYKVTNFHKQEFLDHVYTHECKEFVRKRDRGFAPFIADVVEFAANENYNYQSNALSLVELGIGGGGAHYMWDCHLRGKIYGVELYSPEEKYTEEYNFYNDESNAVRHRNNYDHAMTIINATTQVEFHFGLDAYSAKTAEHIYNRHSGPIDIVIDDADPSGHGLTTLLPAWKPYMYEKGCIISETIYGNGSPSLLKMSEQERLGLLRMAHYQGFVCYDFSKYAYDKPETQDMIHHLVFWSPDIGYYHSVLEKYQDCRVDF